MQILGMLPPDLRFRSIYNAQIEFSSDSYPSLQTMNTHTFCVFNSTAIVGRLVQSLEFLNIRVRHHRGRNELSERDDRLFPAAITQGLSGYMSMQTCIVLALNVFLNRKEILSNSKIRFAVWSIAGHRRNVACNAAVLTGQRPYALVKRKVVPDIEIFLHFRRLLAGDIQIISATENVQDSILTRNQ